MKHYRLFCLVAFFANLLFLCNGCTTKQAGPNVTAASSQPPAEQIELHGLAVLLGMSVDEAAQAFQNIDFKHIPQQRWQRHGHFFLKKEEIRCDVVHLRELNDQLVDARFIFENHRLAEVALTLISVHNSLKPLIDALELHEIQPGLYEGLNGRIVVRADRADAEKITWIISRK